MQGLCIILVKKDVFINTGDRAPFINTGDRAPYHFQENDCAEGLLLVIHVNDADQGEFQSEVDGVGGVGHRSASRAHLLVVGHQCSAQSTLSHHGFRRDQRATRKEKQIQDPDHKQSHGS